MMLRNFLSRFRAGDPVAKVANVRQANRVANILEDITGIGCRIAKPTDAEGKGWQIIVDGSSDVQPPDGWVAPWSNSVPDATGHYKNEVLTLSADDGPPEWDFPRYTVPEET